MTGCLFMPLGELCTVRWLLRSMAVVTTTMQSMFLMAVYVCTRIKMWASDRITVLPWFLHALELTLDVWSLEALSWRKLTLPSNSSCTVTNEPIGQSSDFGRDSHMHCWQWSGWVDIWIKLNPLLLCSHPHIVPTGKYGLKLIVATSGK